MKVLSPHTAVVWIDPNQNFHSSGLLFLDRPRALRSIQVTVKAVAPGSHLEVDQLVWAELYSGDLVAENLYLFPCPHPTAGTPPPHLRSAPHPAHGCRPLAWRAPWHDRRATMMRQGPSVRGRGILEGPGWVEATLCANPTEPASPFVAPEQGNTLGPIEWAVRKDTNKTVAFLGGSGVCKGFAHSRDIFLPLLDIVAEYD
jgi:hypothetical protein